MLGTITYKYQENLRLSIFIKATVSRGASRHIASHAAGAFGPVFPVARKLIVRNQTDLGIHPL